MHCSVFENDEDVPGWKVGSSVAYCESCFKEKMTKEMNYEEDLQKQASGSKIQGAGLSAKTDPLKRYVFRVLLLAAFDLTVNKLQTQIKFAPCITFR